MGFQTPTPVRGRERSFRAGRRGNHLLAVGRKN